ncbi:MAG: NAD(P)/FAD-dependent oxidoreductase, partial [Dermatophilaceae bacterium]
MHTCDVAVVGGGAAGLTAALLLARARRDVVVVDAGEPRNAPALHARGYLSRDDSSPADILAAGRAEVVGYGGTVREGRVDRVDAERTLHLADGERLRAARVLVATGLVDRLPAVPGVAERWGRDVLHCPYCHAWEVRDQPLVVLGTHPNAVHHALLLRQWSAEVTLATHELDPTAEDRVALAARGVAVAEGPVAEVVVGGDAVTGVRVDGEVHPCRAVFLFPHMAPRDDFLGELGVERDPRGFPVVDAGGRTSVPWVYVAGNATDPRAQVVTAAGQGSAVAFALHNELVADEVARAVAE